MKIVIDIDNNLYTRIFDNSADKYDALDMAKAIRKGTPLPKGHGRLIETDELISHLKVHENLLVRHYADENGDIPFFEINSRIDQIRTCIDDIVNAPTIIEADKAESEGHIMTKEVAKTGHWVDADGDNAICGCCNRLNHLYGAYCKHCGARMVSE